LSDKTEEAAVAVFGADVKERPLLARQLGEQNKLDIRWRQHDERAPPPPPSPRPALLDHLRASLEKELEGKIRRVAVVSRSGPPGSALEVESRRWPSDLVERLPEGLIGAAEEIPVFGQFHIAIEGLDGSWLSIKPEKQTKLAPFLRPWFITFFGAAILISILSVFTATRSLRPLDRLVDAAHRLGRSREPVPISTAGLREFKVIADALNEMQSRIKRFLDDRTQMLAAISHDLRTSLTRLRLDAEELADSGTKSQLIANMEEMERMIAATLTLAGDDLKGEPQQRVDLAALLISLCDSLSDHCRPAEYTGPDHALILCQPTAMRRAFANLIDNAVKYGACAQVRLRASTGAALISIADRGPGIPPGQAELAFQPFRRLNNSRDQETGGAGLGLTIARDIVQVHGGAICLRNRPEGGLEVLVQLPMDVAR
jgi:signal transduction histidine kinase